MLLSQMNQIGPERNETSIDLSVSVAAITYVFWIASTLVIAAGLFREIVAFSSGIPSYSFKWNVIWFNGENNIPAWYSSSQLLVCAIVLTALAAVAIRRRSNQAFGWSTLAVGFYALSLDEAAGLHEKVSRLVAGQNADAITGSFQWVLVAAPLVIVIAVILLKFTWRLPVRTRTMLIASGALFVGASVGLEAIGGRFAEAGGWSAFGLTVFTTLEEILEILSITLFLTALLDYIRSTFTTWRVSVV